LEGHVLRRFQQVKGLREALAGREEEVGRLRRVKGRMKVRDGGREGGRGGKEEEREVLVPKNTRE
jgi:hypothetical protein